MMKLKILVAPDSFKGSLTATEVCDCIAEGIHEFTLDVDIELLPLADGGEGTVQSLVDATGGQIINKNVTGPLGKKVKAFYGILGDYKTAVIEMAAASGLMIIPEEKRDPLKTTTYGTGELIKSALEHDITEIIIGIGGSATNDAGIGMAQALGVKFTDKNGEEVGLGGKSLDKIKNINLNGLDQRLKDIEIFVACDVDNPLYGKRGAAYIYAPQKGADHKVVKKLDSNLRYFNEVVKKELGRDINQVAGAGAAGGLGGGLVAFLDAELKKGTDIILETVKFDQKLQGIDLVITGEGMIDGQSIFGKTPIGVGKRAQKHDIPVIAVAGSLGKGVEKVLDHGINAYFSIVDRPDNLNSIIKRSKQLLKNLSEQIARIVINLN